MNSILVAGAGPVGLTAALALARRGFRVTVLESGDDLAAESRASTFHPPTLEMLDDLGVGGELHERGLLSPTFAYRDRAEGLIARLDLAVLSGDTRFPYRLQCEQSKLTPILRDHLLRYEGCEIRYGWHLTGVTRNDTVVTVQSANGDSLDGSWLIGADGAHSATRRAIGTEFEGITYPERFLVASVDEDLAAWLPDLASVNYVFDPVEWCVLLRTPDHWRVLLPTPSETPDHVEHARLDTRLRAVFDPGRPWRIAHASMYRVHQRVAASFRVGRVLLAGDAAHVNNPLGGLGMNSGIHDAIAYAEALSASTPPTPTPPTATLPAATLPTHTFPTTAVPTAAGPTTAGPATAGPTTAGPTTAGPTTAGPTAPGQAAAGPAAVGGAAENAVVEAAVDAAATHRRRIALEYVQSVSHQNYERLRATDPAARATHLDSLRAVAADPVKAHASLLRSSMIASLRPVTA